MGSDPILSVIIVNYNGQCFLDACIDSVRRNLACSHEILVVDNASTDGSVDYLRRHHPELNLIESRHNGGFAAGNNLGAAAARGQYLLLLNNDTVVDSPLDPVLLLMESDPRIGALGCTLMYASGDLQESIGLEQTPLRLLLSWTPLEKRLPRLMAHRAVPASHGDYRREYSEAAWVSGACLLTRSALWKQLQGLDESYFMYVEDTDYCRRVRESGFKVAFTNSARVIHFEGAGRPWRGRRAILDSARSYLVYARKFYSAPGRAIVRFVLPSVFMLRSLAYILAAFSGRDRYGMEKAEAFKAAAAVLVRHQPSRDAITS